jgi:hypothetical protein
MNLISRLLIAFICCIFFNTPGISQKIIETLNVYNDSFVQEKIHVHFDKAAYSVGETIWFKAYIINSNTTLSGSTNFYAELLNEQGNVVERKAYPMYESTAAGSFDIPKSWKGNQLNFRGYTTWMLNFDSSFLFTKAIPVFQSEQKANTTSAMTTTLRFFPEGGNWVANLPAVLAFKATGDNGLPATLSGVIKDQTGKVITPFTTQHDGMGKIALDPLPFAEYYAEWKNASNEAQRVVLPAQQKEGIALHVIPTASHIGFTITRSNTENFKQAHVVAQMYNQVAYRATINFSDKEAGAAIPVKSLVSGILQLTVFDADWRPVAERIIFINKKDYQFTASVNVLNKNLNKRGKNILEIEVPDSLKANLSISVTDADLSDKTNDDDIITRLLLTSDLKGYVHNPAYYFSSAADSVEAHLDLLMLTNGWRRYNWEQLAKGSLPAIKHPRENYLRLEGKVLGLTADQINAATQLNVFMVAKDSSQQVVSLPVEKTGTFALNGIIFFDTVRLFYQFNKNDRANRRATIQFNPISYQRVNLPWEQPMDHATRLSTQYAARIQYFDTRRKEVLPQYDRKVKTLQEVVVRAKTQSRTEYMEKRYASGLFQTGNARNFNILDDPHAVSSFNVLQYLQGKVAGLQIYNSGTSYSIGRRGSSPSLFLDEMPIDIDQLASIPMSDVAYVKVIDPPFVGAPGGGSGGAIVVYTRKGGETSANANTKGLEQGLVTGYASLKEFYSPDYATASPLHEIEDVRSTLYWSPYILTDSTNKKIKIEFYNNDVSQSLRIVLEGMNEDGRLTRVEKVIQ